MAENNGSTQAKKTLLDMNASWALLVVYLAYLIGIFFVQRYFASTLTGLNGYAYIFVSMLVGVLVTFLVYNFGKILFARIAGYRIIHMRLIGVVAERRETKLAFRFDPAALLDIGLDFAPVDDNLDRNPTLIFIGGFVLEAVLLALGIGLFALLGSDTIAGTACLSAVLYGFVIPFYELMPFRQDYPNDMFNIIKTRKADDRQAYNMVAINELREFAGDDFLLPSFQDYDSFYKVQTLIYLYLHQLYENQLEEAVKTLGKIKYLLKDMPDDKKYVLDRENIYLRFLTGDTEGASSYFQKAKSDYRKQIRSPYYLSDFRVALIVCGFFTHDKELLDNLFKDYRKTLSKLPSSPRVEKEKNLFRQVYETIRKNDSNQYLPPLEDESKPA